MDSNRYCQLIVDHYAARWGSDYHALDWRAGPRCDLPEHFRVVRFPPRAERSAWTYATTCMSDPEDEERLELHLLSPVSHTGLVELLTAVAHYHRTDNRLHMGDSVAFGRPWLPGSRCDFGLLSLPYLDGPSIENLEVEDGVVRCLWLIPITRQEVWFKREHGLSALEERFQTKKFEYLDPARESLV